MAVDDACARRTSAEMSRRSQLVPRRQSDHLGGLHLSHPSLERWADHAAKLPAPRRRPSRRTCSRCPRRKLIERDWAAQERTFQLCSDRTSERCLYKRMSDKRYYVNSGCIQVVERRLTRVKAAEVLGLTPRPVTSLCEAFERYGAAGLASRKRGRSSNSESAGSYLPRPPRGRGTAGSGQRDDLLAFALSYLNLSISERTASRSSSRLICEAELGLPLLHRTTQSVAPTGIGEKLLARVAPALRELDAAAVGERRPAGRHRRRCASTPAFASESSRSFATWWPSRSADASGSRSSVRPATSPATADPGHSRPDGIHRGDGERQLDVERDRRLCSEPFVRGRREVLWELRASSDRTFLSSGRPDISTQAKWRPLNALILSCSYLRVVGFKRILSDIGRGAAHTGIHPRGGHIQ